MTIREVLDRYWEGEIDLETAFTRLAEGGIYPSLINNGPVWAVLLGTDDALKGRDFPPSDETVINWIEKKDWHKTIQDAFIYALRRAL